MRIRVVRRGARRGVAVEVEHVPRVGEFFALLDDGPISDQSAPLERVVSVSSSIHPHTGQVVVLVVEPVEDTGPFSWMPL